MPMNSPRRLFRPIALALGLLFSVAGLLPTSSGQTTISSTQNFAYAANAGWIDLRPSTTPGVSIGEFYCNGFAYAANFGWISFGAGTPANGWSYLNNSATDYGVNVDVLAPGVATLRGYAYAANIGWINFESFGNPQVSLVNGKFSGFAYSANVGWINLGDLTYYVQTLAFAQGPDTDGDGIPDAWEFKYFGNLTTANALSDFDGDGVKDIDEYTAGTDPTTKDNPIRITSVSSVPNTTNRDTTITFTSSPRRLYRIDQNDTLLAAWIPTALGTFVPDVGSTTTKLVSIPAPAGGQEFYRVVAKRPLTP